MLDKLKIKSMGSSLSSASLYMKDSKPSRKQIMQNRMNFGVNLGSCFVQEKWISDELFLHNASCELEAARNMIKEKGEEQAAKIFEAYWKKFMSDEDWEWLCNNGINSVRIPIGYWTVDGGKFTKDTAFQGCSSVYRESWNIFKSDFIEKADKYGISVLVDMHGLPKGANGSDHSGEFGNGTPGFWNDSGSQLLMCQVLSFVAADLKKYENIAGIQIVNEAEFSSDCKKQRQYYSAAINTIRHEDNEVPIIISDGWWPNQWVEWLQKHQSVDTSLGVVVDHHCYRCFSDDDKSKPPSQIVSDLDSDLLTNLSNNGTGVDFMIGEYSCVLDSSSWDKNNEKSSRENLVKEFGNRQTQLFQQRATFGSYFWTYKFRHGDGGEWGLKPMMEKQALKPPLNVKKDSAPNNDKLEEKLSVAFEAHVSYWKDQNSKERYEHERYKDGYKTAWNDAREFASKKSILGRLNFWKAMRLHEHMGSKGKSQFLWEWEQGFDKGLSDFRDSL